MPSCWDVSDPGGSRKFAFTRNLPSIMLIERIEFLLRMR